MLKIFKNVLNFSSFKNSRIYMYAYIFQGTRTKAYFCLLSVLIMSSNIHRLILYLFLIFSDISQTRAAGPAQPILKTFPRTQHGQGRTRAFIASWYKDYTWIEYSQCQDSAFCFACRHFSLPSVLETTFNSATGLTLTQTNSV